MNFSLQNEGPEGLTLMTLLSGSLAGSLRGSRI